MAAKIDVGRFMRRLSVLHGDFVKHSEKYGNSAAIALAFGKTREEDLYNKTLSLQNWLFGFLLNEVLLFITSKTVTITCSAKVCNFLEPVTKSSQREGKPYSIVVQERDKANNTALFDALASTLPEKKIAVLSDPQVGPFALEWAAYEKLKAFETFNIAAAFSSLFATKDADALSDMRLAAQLAGNLMEKMVF